MPDRHRAYLVIGQIRAEQGFIPDARTNFLTYAERMSQAGDLDESFRALIEFADLAPDDVGVRLSVADQMIASHREEEAVEQLQIVRAQYLKLGKQADADDIESRILNIDPEAVDLDQPNRLLTDSLTSRGLAVLDPLPEFRAAHEQGRRLHGTVDRHLSPDGHRLLADFGKPDLCRILSGESEGC